ncbi:pickpocket protein 19 [Drosophila nasuta]|uniref:pickpocket protein 19 n=1 Tax=Drosophila nasuta TaxID=42062 RepID=UPI00295E8784|nr:pickpocket protein 19 [Drosophila nasuta]
MMAKEENSEKPKSDEKKCFKELASNYFRLYCERSTIHCVRYLYDPRLHNIEKLIWSVLLVISITLCCSFYLLLSERYGAQKLQTVIEDPQYPVFLVQFPAVAVCTDNRINWSKLEEAKAEFLPANATEELKEGFTKLVSYMETLRFDNFRYSHSELEDQNFEALEFVNISSLAIFMSLTCEDILVPKSCKWRHGNFNCCDYFVTEKSEYGLCLVFNSELSPRSNQIKERYGKEFYPRHNAKAGQSSGLNFSLRLHERFKRPNSKATDNVYIMIKKGNQMSNVVYSITPNTETYVTIRPQATRTDETTRNIAPERRNCHFDDEQKDFGTSDAPRRFSKSFLLLNCLNNCHESYLVRLCNCTLPIFFLSNQKVKDCTAVSLRCISRHNDIFSYDKHLGEDDFFSASKPGMTCPCLVSCNVLEYFTSTTTLPLTGRNISASHDFFKVDVHYQVENMITYRTSLEFSSIDLIANLGGIFGLCLGASMVSGVELVYYLTVGFGLHLYDNAYYGLLRDNLKQKWAKWLFYLRNGLSHAHHDTMSAEAKSKSQLRHPFNNRINAW